MFNLNKVNILQLVPFMITNHSINKKKTKWIKHGNTISFISSSEHFEKQNILGTYRTLKSKFVKK